MKDNLRVNAAQIKSASICGIFLFISWLSVTRENKCLLSYHFLSLHWSISIFYVWKMLYCKYQWLLSFG